MSRKLFRDRDKAAREKIARERADSIQGKTPFIADVGVALPPLPFTDEPKLTLIYHMWPRANWRRHIEKLKVIEDRFATKRMGIAMGPDTAPLDEVMAEFPGWEFHSFPNNPNLGEYHTLRWGLEGLQSGTNDVTFYSHSKGTQDHTALSDSVEWWTDAMYETVLHNIDSVLESLEAGAAFSGSFRYAGMTFVTHNSWHFSGTFWAFRNCVVLPNAAPIKKTYHGTESWPGDNVPLSQSHCMFGELAYPWLYTEKRQPRKRLQSWRERNAGTK